MTVIVPLQASRPYAKGEFDQLDPYVTRAGFALASEVAGGHTLLF
jgi:hypothetical protein